jgi:hypothetical protein
VSTLLRRSGTPMPVCLVKDSMLSPLLRWLRDGRRATSSGTDR